MTPAHIRWRCERMDELLPQMPRLEALATVRQEEFKQPWLTDLRPVPPPLPMGDARHGLNPTYLRSPE